MARILYRLTHCLACIKARYSPRVWGLWPARGHSAVHSALAIRVLSALCKRRRSIVTANTFFFFFLFLFFFLLFHFRTGLCTCFFFVETSAMDWELEHKVENGFSSHRNNFY